MKHINLKCDSCGALMHLNENKTIATCPYCNNEFIAEINGKDEIKCPECNNMIELDWDDEEEHGCSGHCSSCHGCSDDFEEDDDEENNEDDM